MPNIGRVRAALQRLPNVEEGTTFGYPAFKIGGKAFAWFPKKKEVEPDTLAVRAGGPARVFPHASCMLHGLFEQELMTNHRGTEDRLGLIPPLPSSESH
jgi:hypothetical protein